LRSNNPMLVMLVDAGNFGSLDEPGRLTDMLGEVVKACVRQSDICGILKEDVLIGVILTANEAGKVGSSPSVVAGKTRERLGARLSHEMAGRIAITFHIFPSVVSGTAPP
jgi:hypothetical protein